MRLTEVRDPSFPRAESSSGPVARRPEARWFRALLLTERAQSLSDIRLLPNASLHKLRWREIPGLTDEESFRRRLAAEGINEAQFERALAETPEELRGRCAETPDWLASLLDAYSTDTSVAALEDPAAAGFASFLSLVEPLVRRAQVRVRDGATRLLAAFPAAPFDPNAVEPMLHAHLAGRLTQLVSLPAVLEMHIARLEGRLNGDTPEERFRDFARSLGEPAVARRLFAEYPVLARLVVQAVDQWVATSLEFLEQLSRDSADLRATFHGGEGLGQLSELETGAGDAHRGGRSVRVLQFTSGLRVAYKPRSLAVDRHFMELLTWLNERRGELPAFRVLRVLDRADHGWAEFVEHIPCQTEQEVDRFYRRQGMNLALLHALGARDFHHENVIASGEHPVLIDLESLLAPYESGLASDLSFDRAVQDITRSVLAVGLLPFRVWTGKSSDGIDLSGLGTPAGQTTPLSMSVWEDIGTDAVRRQRRRVPLEESNNRPTLTGCKISVGDHAEALTHGFTAMYRLLKRHRDQLLAADGPLAAFVDDEVRAILRPTASYGVLLTEGCHPDVLRDALARDRLFDYLWAPVGQRSELAQVFAQERADLWRGDIPYFTTRPGSCDLWDSRGEKVRRFFPASGMELLRRRLGQFGAGDLARQLWYIRASLSSLAGKDRHAAGVGTRRVAVAEGTTRERLLAAARAVGDRLAGLAVYGDDDAAWNGLVFAGNRHPLIAPLGLDLYEGLPGVTLFLAQLGAVTGEDRFTILALAGLTTQLRLLDGGSAPFATVGAFSGLGGLIYELTRLAALWDRIDLRQRAEALADTLPPLVEHDEQFDVLGGSAGCLGCLLALYRKFPSDRTLAVARRCGDRLLTTGRATGPGLGWLVPGVTDRPLAGFSHGTAGIAWALLGLWDVTGDDRYQDAARKAIAYERSLFHADVGNWLDLRPRAPGEDAGARAFMTAWCHGAVGIGLARLGRLQQMDDAEVRAEIESAVRTTLAQG
ncbi:MAG: type 2 lanthipeptide synthetase LanM family protein, partial [Gammaproteobacteria bacterium]